MYAYVDTLEKFKRWEDLGADTIILSPHINRNFDLLKKIAEYKKCEVEVIANLSCLYQCPYSFYHSVLETHASQKAHKSKGFVVDYCILNCSYIKAKNPMEIIRSPWIRPEDLHYYQDIGIDRCKLTDRTRTTDKIVSVVEAYTNRNYEGNLIDILLTFQGKGRIELNAFRKMKYFLHPLFVNVFRLKKMENLLYDFKVYIDNRKLDGFLEYFLRQNCFLTSCKDCGYCEKIAKEVVVIEPDSRFKTVNKLEEAKNEIASGRIFRYFSKDKEK